MSGEGLKKMFRLVVEGRWADGFVRRLGTPRERLRQEAIDLQRLCTCTTLWELRNRAGRPLTALEHRQLAVQARLPLSLQTASSRSTHAHLSHQRAQAPAGLAIRVLRSSGALAGRFHGHSRAQTAYSKGSQLADRQAGEDATRRPFAGTRSALTPKPSSTQTEAYILSLIASQTLV